jgi:hypothetical protein
VLIVNYTFGTGTDFLTTAGALIGIVLGIVNAWALFRRGTVKMTQPTIIFFGPDASIRSKPCDDPPKVFLRTLLFSTAKRGRIVESMHVTLSRNETRQNFNVWVYGNDKLVRGSGLFVGETGVEANHHFLAPRDATTFQFVEGQYRLEVFARLLGDARHTQLFSQALDITRDLAASLAKPHTGVYFDWGPDSLRYLPHVETRTPPPITLFESLANAEFKSEATT